MLMTTLDLPLALLSLMPSWSLISFGFLFEFYLSVLVFIFPDSFPKTYTHRWFQTSIGSWVIILGMPSL